MTHLELSGWILSALMAGVGIGILFCLYGSNTLDIKRVREGLFQHEGKVYELREIKRSEQPQ